MTRAISSHRSGRGGGWLLLLLLVLVGVFLLGQCPDGSRRYPIVVKQKAQLHSIDAAVELFSNEFEAYPPPSDSNDVTGSPYCGAMRLAEAMMGQDLIGFHRKSVFRADGLDPNARASLYTSDTLKERIGLFLPLENANAYKLVDIYGKGKTGPFPENAVVLCDVFEHILPSGKKAGMPILYYRAGPSGTKHDPDNPDDPQNIYDYRDNLSLLQLGIPGDPNAVHPLAHPRRFYLNTRNDRAGDTSRPRRPDSCILISAGYDGLYGTADDILNVEWSYSER